jgi:hypothetical protein
MMDMTLQGKADGIETTRRLANSMIFRCLFYGHSVESPSIVPEYSALWVSAVTVRCQELLICHPDGSVQT